MGQPVNVAIEHSLGTDEAKSHIENSFHKLGEMVPGARLSDHRWDGDNLHFSLKAMGQKVKGELRIDEDEVQAIVDLPMMLSMYAGSIKQTLREEGPKLLEMTAT